MKESIGGTQLFIIVISLIIVFTAIMSFTINHSNAFAIKDKVVTIVEEAGGFDVTSQIVGSSSSSSTLKKIVDTLSEESYRQEGKCPESDGKTEVVGYDRNGAKSSSNKSSFCIVKIPASSDGGGVTKYYYQIIVFYGIDFPILNQMFVFRAIGETKPLYA